MNMPRGDADIDAVEAFDTRVAAYGVITDGTKLLLVHFDDGVRGRWTLPGGGLHLGESPQEAAIREIYEETGHHVELGALLGFDTQRIPSHHRIGGSARPLHSLRIVYEAAIVGGELRRERNGTTDEVRWFDVDLVAYLPRVDLVDAGIALLLRADEALEPANRSGDAESR